MNINFKASNIALTDEIRSYTEEKVAMVKKLIPGTAEENIKVDVDLSKKSQQQSGEIFRADITIYAGAEKTHAVGHGETILAALDASKDELSERVSRSKKRRMDLVRKGGAKIKSMIRFWK